MIAPSGNGENGGHMSAAGGDAPLRKLIFYGTTGPDDDDDAWAPFSMAYHSLDHGFPMEIYLAGAATGLLRHSVRSQLEGRVKSRFDAVMEAGVTVSFSPG